MATVRSFLAIEVSGSVLSAAQKVIRAFSAGDVPAVRWVHPEQMHITLKFFGNIAPELTNDICHHVQGVVDETEPFEFEVAGVGAFPSNDRPRTIWAGVTSGSDPIIQLVHRIEGALEPLGFPRERRQFHPHLTLGRVKGRGPLHSLSSRIAEFDEKYELGVTTVDELLLLSSELQPTGPIYSRMATLEFGG
jgi:2'-5' RNA ligase